MISLVYVSSTIGLLSKAELITLLEQSRIKNERLKITGLLLYRDGNVIQVLEGPVAAVRQLFNRIKVDPRHHGVLRLMERPIEARQFSDWSMSFKDLNDPAIHQHLCYSEFMNSPLDSDCYRLNASLAYTLLDLFRRNMG